MGALRWLEGNFVSVKRSSVVSKQSCGLGSPNTYKCCSVKAVEFVANHQLLRLIKNMWRDVTHLNDKLPELKQPITISLLIWLFWNGFHCQLEQVKDSFAGENGHILDGKYIQTVRKFVVLLKTLRWLRKPCVGPSIFNFRDDTCFKNEAVTWQELESFMNVARVNRVGWTFFHCHTFHIFSN